MYWGIQLAYILLEGSGKYCFLIPGPAPEGYDYKGCFLDSSDRTLNGKLTKRYDLTPEICKDLCSGYKYFGLEYSKECFCGDELWKNVEEDELQCNMGCTGISITLRVKTV